MKKNKIALFFLVGIFISSPSTAEVDFFIGGDTMDMEVKIGYLQAAEFYNFTGLRYRLGLETDSSFSFGLEYALDVENEIIDIWGGRVNLAVENAFGAYITMGEPVYLRIGWSSWEATYTLVDWNFSDKDRMTSLDYGIGVKINVGPVAIYGEYIQRNATASFADIFTKPAGYQHSSITYDSELYVAGVTFSF